MDRSLRPSLGVRSNGPNDSRSQNADSRPSLRTKRRGEVFPQGPHALCDKNGENAFPPGWAARAVQRCPRPRQFGEVLGEATQAALGCLSFILPEAP